MIGPKRRGQERLFHYGVRLGERVPQDHLLRRIDELVDFEFVRTRVSGCYGKNGHLSEDPIVIMKLMLLLFLESVKSERELLRTLPMRLDWLWILGMGLESEIPNHSVLSKARQRWGPAVFAELFERVVRLCVEAELVGGEKIHLDGSLVDADASVDSLQRAGLKRVYQETEEKLTRVEPEKRKWVSRTDPEASVVGDYQYGTNDNYRLCVERKIRCHLGDVKTKHAQEGKWFPLEAFEYEAEGDVYRCPAGEVLVRSKRKKDLEEGFARYRMRNGVCPGCDWKSECTRSKRGRELRVPLELEKVQQGRRESLSGAGYQDRRRRKHLIEGSFGDAARNHHFKRARWRGLEKQSIQDHLIAVCQNLRLLFSRGWYLKVQDGVAASELGRNKPNFPFFAFFRVVFSLFPGLQPASSPLTP